MNVENYKFLRIEESPPVYLVIDLKKPVVFVWKSHEFPSPDELNDISSLIKSNIIDSQKKHYCIRLNVNHNCNLNCLYCWQEKIGYKSEIYMSESFLNEFYEKFFKFIKNDIEVIRITGGEPFLNRDWQKWLKNLKINGSSCSVIVNTNGTLIEHDDIQKLAQIGRVFIFISIDPEPSFGRNKFKGSVDLKALIKEIQECKISIGFSSVVSSINQKLDDFIDFCIDCKINSLALNIDYNLSLKKETTIPQFADKLISLWEKGRENRLNISGQWLRPVQVAVVNRTLFCSGKGEELNIFADGTISRCPGDQVKLGSIYNFDIALDEIPPFTMSGACNKCLIAQFCQGGCILWKDKNENPNPFICEIMNNVFKKFFEKYWREFFEPNKAITSSL